MFHVFRKLNLQFTANFFKVAFTNVCVCLKSTHMKPKSLYISRAMCIFYGTEIEIWAGFGPVSNTEKEICADYEQLLRAVFSCFQGQKKV